MEHNNSFVVISVFMYQHNTYNIIFSSKNVKFTIFIYIIWYIFYTNDFK